MFSYLVDNQGNIIAEHIGDKINEWVNSEEQIDATRYIYKNGKFISVLPKYYALVIDGNVSAIKKWESTRDFNMYFKGWVESSAEVEVGWTFDGNVFAAPPVSTLIDEQSKKWDEIKSAREAAINAPIKYLGKLFDFDEKGAKNLSDAVLAANCAKALNVPFPTVTWTLYDNTTQDLTQDQLLAFPLQAGLLRKGTVHAYARTLREEIYKQDATIESVQAVIWCYREPGTA